MKRLIPSLLVIVILVVYSCESYDEELEVVFLPVNMTATIIQGTETKKIIADFHYVPDADLIDHITWSNHQTHYFEYDELDEILVVRQMKVDIKVQEEKWFQYDGALVVRINLVKRNLDYTFLEPIDSIYAGYITFEYQGESIVEEKRYEVSEDAKKTELVWKVDYEYDTKGNLLSSIASDPRTKSSESVIMTYDNSKHPFSDLHYYFSGESYVNNLLSKTLVEEGFEYNYELNLNEHGYPEIIYEKLGTTNTRIIRYSYISS